MSRLIPKILIQLTVDDLIRSFSLIWSALSTVKDTENDSYPVVIVNHYSINTASLESKTNTVNVSGDFVLYWNLML